MHVTVVPNTTQEADAGPKQSNVVLPMVLSWLMLLLLLLMLWIVFCFGWTSVGWSLGRCLPSSVVKRRGQQVTPGSTPRPRPRVGAGPREAGPGPMARPTVRHHASRRRRIKTGRPFSIRRPPIALLLPSFRSAFLLLCLLGASFWFAFSLPPIPTHHGFLFVLLLHVIGLGCGRLTFPRRSSQAIQNLSIPSFAYSRQLANRARCSISLKMMFDSVQVLV